MTLIDRRIEFINPPLIRLRRVRCRLARSPLPLRYVLNRQKNTKVLLGEVVDMDVDKRELLLKDHSRIAYDTAIFGDWFDRQLLSSSGVGRFCPRPQNGGKTRPRSVRGSCLFERAEKDRGRCGSTAREPYVRHRAAAPRGVELAGRYRRGSHGTR